MKKVTLTFKEIKQFDQIGRIYVQQKNANEKLKYWIARALDRLEPIFKQYSEGIEDLRVKYANEKDGKIDLNAQGQFNFTKENFILLREEVKAYEMQWEFKEFQVDKYSVKQLPEELQPAEAYYLSTVIDFPEQELSLLLDDNLEKPNESEQMALVK